MVVKSGNALRRNGRGAGRPREGLPRGHNVALHRTRSPSRTGGSVQAGGHCCPRGVAPLPHHAAMEDHEQNPQSSRRNSRPSQQILWSFLSRGSKSFRLKFARCCSRCGRTWVEQRHHRSLVPCDAMPIRRSSFRLLAMASPCWMIYVSY